VSDPADRLDEAISVVESLQLYVDLLLLGTSVSGSLGRGGQQQSRQHG
jgi:hypothetical protein